MKNFSYDLGKADLVGYGENEIYGHFVIFGSMDISYLEQDEQMIFF